MEFPQWIEKEIILTFVRLSPVLQTRIKPSLGLKCMFVLFYLKATLYHTS